MKKKPKCVENGHSKLETTRKIEKREIEAWWLVFLCQVNSTWSNTQNCLKFFAKKNLAENCFRNKHVRSLYLMKKIMNNRKFQKKVYLNKLPLSSMKIRFFQLVCFQKLISILKAFRDLCCFLIRDKKHINLNANYNLQIMAYIHATKKSCLNISCGK